MRKPPFCLWAGLRLSAGGGEAGLRQERLAASITRVLHDFVWSTRILVKPATVWAVHIAVGVHGFRFQYGDFSRLGWNGGEGLAATVADLLAAGVIDADVFIDVTDRSETHIGALNVPTVIDCRLVGLHFCWRRPDIHGLEGLCLNGAGHFDVRVEFAPPPVAGGMHCAMRYNGPVPVATVSAISQRGEGYAFCFGLLSLIS